MTYEVRLSPQAVIDLRHLYEEKQVENSHHAAAWFIGLETAVFSLESMPQRGVATPEDRSLHHLLYGNKPHIYRIIYSIGRAIGSGKHCSDSPRRSPAACETLTVVPNDYATIKICISLRVVNLRCTEKA